MTEAAGKLSTMVTDLQSKIEKLPVGYPCPSSLFSAQPSPCSPCNSGSGSPFHGFASTALTSTASNEDLLQYVRMRDPNIGPAAGDFFQPEARHCKEKIPAPPPGAHVHHVYVEDRDCQHDAGQDGRGGRLSSTSTSSDGEIEIRERKRTTVTVGKKRSAKGGRPPSKRRN